MINKHIINGQNLLLIFVNNLVKRDQKLLKIALKNTFINNKNFNKKYNKLKLIFLKN